LPPFPSWHGPWKGGGAESRNYWFNFIEEYRFRMVGKSSTNGLYGESEQDYDLRLYGAAATWDRDTCRTCHETGTCIACHQSTTPMNHIGAWNKAHGLTARGKADGSCTVCHSPGYCATCHGGN